MKIKMQVPGGHLLEPGASMQNNPLAGKWKLWYSISIVYSVLEEPEHENGSC